MGVVFRLRNVVGSFAPSIVVTRLKSAARVEGNRSHVTLLGSRGIERADRCGLVLVAGWIAGLCFCAFP